MSKRWIHCDVAIYCTRELQNLNFLVKFRLIFLRFVTICFHFVCISRRVTHCVRGAPVKIQLQGSVLIFRAELSVLANEVIFNIPKSILGD